jgi:hypothetical protein
MGNQVPFRRIAVGKRRRECLGAYVRRKNLTFMVGIVEAISRDLCTITFAYVIGFHRTVDAL